MLTVDFFEIWSVATRWSKSGKILFFDGFNDNIKLFSHDFSFGKAWFINKSIQNISII